MIGVLLVVPVLLAVPFLVLPVNAQQATGQTTILVSTCGISFPDGNTVNYGGLLRNTISSEVTLNMNNTGTVTALLEISGDDWKDGSNNPVMNSNRTHFNNSAFQNTYFSKALLNATDATVTSTFVPSILLKVIFQLQSILLNAGFTGTATQTMDFTVSC